MNDVRDGGGDRLVLWDIAHVRLASDWKPPPAAAAPSASVNARGAYNDDAQIYAYRQPLHVVSPPGKMPAPHAPSVNIVLNSCMPEVSGAILF